MEIMQSTFHRRVTRPIALGVSLGCMFACQAPRIAKDEPTRRGLEKHASNSDSSAVHASQTTSVTSSEHTAQVAVQSGDEALRIVAVGDIHGDASALRRALVLAG